jgi:hypothetical protein
MRKEILAMTEVPLWRLNALRAGYLLLVAGLGAVVWPGIIHHDRPWELMRGVVHCMLAALSALAILGLRYPLRMLPLLFFELAWKSIWLIVVARPLWSAHRMDADTMETAMECLMAVVFVAVIPWRYAISMYLATGADRWLPAKRLIGSETGETAAPDAAAATVAGMPRPAA